MDVRKIRVDNLNLLASMKEYGGNKASLARTLGYTTPSYLSQLTSDTKNSRPFTEQVARDIEAKLRLPSGWMDVDRKSQAAATSGEAVSEMMTKLSDMCEKAGVALSPKKFTALVELAMSKPGDEAFLRRLISLVTP